MDTRRDYLLFIDESGKSSLSDRGENFLLTGLILDKELHAALCYFMLSLKTKASIPPTENLHAYNIFEDEKLLRRDSFGRVLKDGNGNLLKKRLPYSKLDSLFERLVNVIDGTEMRCFIYRLNKEAYLNRVDRAQLREKASEKAINKYLNDRGLNDFLYGVLTRKLILRFGHFLEQNDAYGEVIAESRRNGDSVVLDAFLDATHDKNFIDTPRFEHWSKCSHARIHGLTFQTKRGLSFGLEVADLFSWAHFNEKYGSRWPTNISDAKKRRVTNRISTVAKLLRTISSSIEDMSESSVRRVAYDRVSKFIDDLSNFRNRPSSLGTPPGNPGGP